MLMMQRKKTKSHRPHTHTHIISPQPILPSSLEIAKKQIEPILHIELHPFDSRPVTNVEPVRFVLVHFFIVVHSIPRVA